MHNNGFLIMCEMRTAVIENTELLHNAFIDKHLL